MRQKCKQRERKGAYMMPYWLHNTLFVLLLIVTFGCVSSGIEWKKKPQPSEN